MLISSFLFRPFLFPALQFPQLPSPFLGERNMLYFLILARCRCPGYRWIKRTNLSPNCLQLTVLSFPNYEEIHLLLLQVPPLKAIRWCTIFFWPSRLNETFVGTLNLCDCIRATRCMAGLVSQNISYPTKVFPLDSWHTFPSNVNHFQRFKVYRWGLTSSFITVAGPS